MKILVLDNYDSFVYNIVYILKQIPFLDITVAKNDEIAINEIQNFDKIILSPGPGLPVNSGIMLDLIKQFHTHKPILGICLGHQAIAEYFGCSLNNLKIPLHGVTSKTTLNSNHYLFEGIPNQIMVGHYHSWIVNKLDVLNKLILLAQDEQNNCMALAHPEFDCVGLQFHPESILTEYGLQMIQNWVSQPIIKKTY